MENEARVFTSYDVQTCLYDTARVELFETALSKAVRPGDVVVDGGSGTGLLGLLAAKMGAARVYCVELNPEFAAIIDQNAIRNGMQDRVIVLNDDATTVELPEPVDVIVSEVMSTAFFYEPQLAIMENLRRHLRPGGVIIPTACETQVELIWAQEMLYGLRFAYDSRIKVLDDHPLTERKTYLSVDYTGEIPRRIEAGERLLAHRTGTVNAVRFSYQLEFTRGVWAGEPTEFLLNPRVVYLDAPMTVEEGGLYDVRLGYDCGASPLTCEIDIRRVD